MLAYSIMSEAQIQEFESELEMNLAFTAGDIGRFRANVFKQRGEVSMVVRHIKTEIPSIIELNLPSILNELVMEPRGLILVVGSSGSGKSTTLASMIDHRNRSKTGHILTIEDPIEFMHEHQQSVIEQREVGMDTKSYAHALSNAMREAPDLIMIGEITDMETMQQAIAYAETGHLCMATLHASNAYLTLERIMNFFPDSAHRQLYDVLSLNLRGIVSQRLLMGTDGKRLPAVEVMLNTPYISDLIQRGEVGKVKKAMDTSEDRGMKSFDQAVYDLYAQGRVSTDEALKNANSPDDVKVRIRLSHGDQATGLDELDL
ncbi:MAG: PilT/PilU family type 4a pilus ATPase, partial [Gammaproteobacteria bacterium]|nr:PilT/PilU family type 4a pilus ATPase [Gammaproteobacteria bacterium]